MHKSLWRENLESLIAAVIFILIVRFFCLEPFKIPSTSMEPTLIGDPGCGDQILVNKFIYHFRDPERWEVIVFRCPLNPRRNFIKRLIGLPGEEVAIQNGNIYINGQIARKPPRVQEALLFPLFEGDSLKETWTMDEKWQQRDHSLILKTKDPAWCIYGEEITNEYAPGSDHLFLKRRRSPMRAGGEHRVGEILLAFDLSILSAHGTALAQIRESYHRFCLYIGHERNCVEWYKEESGTPYRSLPFSYSWKPGQKYRIELSNLDELFSVRIEDKTILTLDYSCLLNEAMEDAYESYVQFGGMNGSFEFSNVSLWRDVYYMRRENKFEKVVWNVPHDHYFVLGDNSPQSNDSRDWKVFRMMLKNGTFLEGDQQQPPLEEKNTHCFTDVDGVERRVPVEEEKETISYIPYPFVPRDYLVGRAFTVFWPPPRVKIIR